MPTYPKMRLPARRDDAAARDDGFTLVEMVVTVSLIAVLFVAVAMILDSSLRALSASKARARGNDIATQAIEDLQRFPFNSLGLCAPPAGTPPAGLDNWVKLPSCPAAGDPLFEEPCNDPGGNIPVAQYTCRRNNLDYTVKRYVAWVDALQTTKRLAVYVEWDDLVGRHQVSQQSSLRAPDQAAIVGLDPPKFSNSPAPSATAVQGGVPVLSPVLTTATQQIHSAWKVRFEATTVNLDPYAASTTTSAIGTHAQGAVVQVNVAAFAQFPTYNGFPVIVGHAGSQETFRLVSGAGTSTWRLRASGTTVHPANSPIVFNGDEVHANFQTIGSNNSPKTTTVKLSSTDGTTWVGEVTPTDGYRFGSGSQYASFNIFRAADGKTSAAYATPALQFCPESNADCTGIVRPTISIDSVPASVPLGARGELLNDFTVKVTTTGITNIDTVSLNFLTRSGSLVVTLVQDPTAPTPCPSPSTATASDPCKWIGTVTRSSGHQFSSDDQHFYFAAQQVYDSENPSSIDKGSTGAARTTTQVPFG
jgi:prepilin-type N-terminal cleavage/methylation domain-containing protein